MAIYVIVALVAVAVTLLVSIPGNCKSFCEEKQKKTQKLLEPQK